MSTFTRKSQNKITEAVEDLSVLEKLPEYKDIALEIVRNIKEEISQDITHRKYTFDDIEINPKNGPKNSVRIYYQCELDVEALWNNWEDYNEVGDELELTPEDDEPQNAAFELYEFGGCEEIQKNHPGVKITSNCFDVRCSMHITHYDYSPATYWEPEELDADFDGTASAILYIEIAQKK